MRVVSWNVRSLRDGSRGVAAALAALQPDVALIQEAPRLLLWQWSCWLLARRSGLVRVAGGAPAAGNLLLVSPRVVVVESRAVRLPRRPGLHRRGAVLATVEVRGQRLTVLGTHLDLDATARVATARALRALVPATEALVVGADVNEEPGGPAWTVLAEGLADAAADCGPTFPARGPARRIDALLVDPRLRVAAIQRPDPGPVSDHLPLVADLGS